MKKGFTLIELLAVIVILAVIALIAVPTITKVVEKSRKSAAISSANGYVDAIHEQIVMNQLNSSLGAVISDGTYNIKDLKINIKGQGPVNGIVVIKKSRVTGARLCFGKYSVDFDGNKSKLSENNYCGNSGVTLLSNGSKISSSTKSTTFTVDLKGKTNIN